MSTHEPLSPAELQGAMSELEGWEIVDGALRRRFKFAGFDAAFAFMTRVAREAHRLNHHPTWTNSYNRVEITLLTHRAGRRITALDVELARRINRLLETDARD